MSQLPYQFAPPPIPRDRRTGLIVFGIFALVIGGFAACFAIFTPLALLMASAMGPRPGPAPGGGTVMVHGAPDTRSIASAIVVYTVVATAFIAGGVGSIRTRRWARPLMLSVAWTWLLVGVFGSVMWVALLPSMRQIMTPAGGGPAPPPGFADAMVWIMSAFMVAVYLALPVVFILFYRSPHVRTTLEHYDPNPGWADRAPVSVFGLALALGATALFTLPMVAYGAFPLFNTMLTGPAATVAIVALAGAFAAAAYLVFRLRRSGWWLTLAISVIVPLAMIVSMQTIGVAAIYEAMGMPPEQIDAIRGNALMRGPLIPVATGLLGVAGVVYLVAVRKSFVASAGSDGRGTVASEI